MNIPFYQQSNKKNTKANGSFSANLAIFKHYYSSLKPSMVKGVFGKSLLSVRLNDGGDIF